MKKTLILGAMAFFAINIASVQDANAQVNKQREQIIQSAKDTSEANHLDPEVKLTNDLNNNAKVTKQREQFIQAKKQAGDSIVINHQGSITHSKIKHETSFGKSSIASKKQAKKELKIMQDSIHQNAIVNDREKTDQDDQPQNPNFYVPRSNVGVPK